MNKHDYENEYSDYDDDGVDGAGVVIATIFGVCVWAVVIAWWLS